MGMAMFAALAVGAPIGIELYAFGGFLAVACATTLVPLVTVVLLGLLKAVPPQHGTQAGLLKVARAVWMPGVGSAFSTIGFGAMIGFSSLLAAARGWSPLWPFSTFAISLVIARLFFGYMPDRLGGAKVALVSVFIEAAGLALIWLAPDRASGALGAALTGFGHALVYPGLGVEAVSRAPAKSRGLAMGAYTVFPRRGARVRQSCTRTDRRMGRFGRGVSCKCAHCAGRSGYRRPAPDCRFSLNATTS
jgi:hypothetical protein